MIKSTGNVSDWSKISKDKVIFNKFYFPLAHSFLCSCLNEARAHALVPQWVLRPFSAHERSKPGARYARRCFSESCLCESCLSEATSVTTLKVYTILIYTQGVAHSRAAYASLFCSRRCCRAEERECSVGSPRFLERWTLTLKQSSNWFESCKPNFQCI